MEEEFNFDNLLDDIFGDKVSRVKLNPGIQGKKIAIYSPDNNVGKTRQAARFCDNTIFIPFEEGLNAVAKGNALKTSNWADFRGHTAKLTRNPKFLAALKLGKEIAVVLDGMETMSLFCKQWLCDQAGVEKFAKAGSMGAQWSDYETEMYSQVLKLSKMGFTLIFIGHAKPSKNEEDGGAMDFACDWRTAKPIKDVCDFVFYVEGNGSDENEEVIPSSAWLNPHKGENGFFARSRFPQVQTFFEVFDAKIIKQAIYDGIVKQAELEGAEIVGFEEAREMYDNTFTINYKDAMNEILDMLEDCDAKGLTKQADAILLNYMDNVAQVEELTETQMQTVQSIHQDLKELLY